MAEKLTDLGAKSVVITGILGDNTLTNLVFENGKSTEITIQKSRKAFSGTGDIFASIVTGLLCKGKTLVNAVNIASKYIFDVIELTIRITSYNVCYTKLLRGKRGSCSRCCGGSSVAFRCWQREIYTLSTSKETY